MTNSTSRACSASVRIFWASGAIIDATPSRRVQRVVLQVGKRKLSVTHHAERNSPRITRRRSASRSPVAITRRSVSLISVWYLRSPDSTLKCSTMGASSMMLMRSLATRAPGSLPLGAGSLVQASASGPARTFYLVLEAGRDINDVSPIGAIRRSYGFASRRPSFRISPVPPYQSAM